MSVHGLRSFPSRTFNDLFFALREDNLDFEFQFLEELIEVSLCHTFLTILGQEVPFPFAIVEIGFHFILD
jgi:hypothetical protein